MAKAVVLLSGGLDSATVLAIAKSELFECYAISFDYGQRHRRELEAARLMAEAARVSAHQVISFDLRAFGGSALTSDMDVPKGRDLAGNSNEIPSTYVPARNTIFLSFALAWAEVLGSSDIFLGINALDYSGYPDCRPEYISAFERMANLATRAGLEGRQITIHTPLITLSKRDIVLQGVALGLDFELTSTCYDPAPDGAACGRCEACLLRLKGFREAGIPDPARYQAALA